VHYVHDTPIDYTKEMYLTAQEKSVRGTEESLCEDYYDLQYEMLTELKPRVVGHFDLIRLMSEDPEKDLRQWEGVWERVLRNLALAKEQDGWLEVNSAGLRKGLAEPYPCRLIAEVR
jgi:histidinol-phosphatase (PHP family)